MNNKGERKPNGIRITSPKIANETRRTWTKIRVKTPATAAAGAAEIRMANILQKIASGIRTIVDGISMIKSGLNKTDAHET